MREICTSGSEGGGALTGSPYLYSKRHVVGCCEELAARFLAPQVQRDRECSIQFGQL